VTNQDTEELFLAEERSCRQCDLGRIGVFVVERNLKRWSGARSLRAKVGKKFLRNPVGGGNQQILWRREWNVRQREGKGASIAPRLNEKGRRRGPR